MLDGVARLNVDVTRTLQPGDVLAGYRLIRELGRGGMSVVWLAERADGVVKRTVALKMPMFMLQGGDVERFARERDALAALSHPNVARLYDAGVLPSGQPFIVLEHVDGLPLNVHCDAQRLDLRARLRLFLQVLGAVEHAHKHLIVHRDLKPSNILVDAEGQVKLLDFGIAKLLGENEAAAPLTELSGAAMTPLYAAPEQLRGATISTLTDVYSLGVVLHELLTRRAAVSRRRRARLAGGDPGVPEPRRAAARESGGHRGRRGHCPRAPDGGEIARRARRRPRHHRGQGAADRAGRTLRLGGASRRRPEALSRSAAHRRATTELLVCDAAGDHAAPARRPVWPASDSRWWPARAWSRGCSSVESRAHAERTAAVRNFMFDLVSDAETRKARNQR